MEHISFVKLVLIDIEFWFSQALLIKKKKNWLYNLILGNVMSLMPGIIIPRNNGIYS
jgi:hypothetical protein